MRRWHAAHEALRLCSASRSRSVRPLKLLSSPGSVPASAGGGGVGVPSTRRSTQSPRFTGLVRSGADVVVSTEPRRSAPPRLNASAPSTFTSASADGTSLSIAVELRQRLVQERVVGVQDLLHRPAFADDVLEGRDRFVVHRRLDLVGELGEARGVDAAILIEVVEAEPLPEELGGEAARLRIGGHPLHLPGQLRRIAQLAGGRGAAQLVVRNRRPEEEAQAAGHLPAVQRLLARAGDASRRDRGTPATRECARSRRESRRRDRGRCAVRDFW